MIRRSNTLTPERTNAPLRWRKGCARRSSRDHRWLIGLGLALALAACGDDTIPGDTGPADSGPADATGDAPNADSSTLADGGPVDSPAIESRIEIGTGVTEFGAAADNTMELVAGPQGGWHLDIALKLYGVEPDFATLRLSGVDATTGEALTNPIERSLTRRRVLMVDDYFLRLGDQLVFDIDNPSLVTERDVRVMVELEEAGGIRTMAERVVRVLDEVR